jgi:hypothetical protein
MKQKIQMTLYWIAQVSLFGLGSTILIWIGAVIIYTIFSINTSSLSVFYGVGLFWYGITVVCFTIYVLIEVFS